MHAKQELEAYSKQQEYSTCIHEAQEYSHEKVEHVSLPHKNARIQFIQNITKQK